MDVMKVTDGKRRRRLMGLDGRIRHLEMLDNAGHRKILEGFASLKAEVANLAAGLALARAEITALTPAKSDEPGVDSEPVSAPEDHVPAMNEDK